MGLGFLSVSQAVVPISTGPIEVPILYREAQSILALFPLEPGALEAELRPLPLEPVPLLGGKPALVVAFFDYRDTTIGPYHEAAVATIVVPRGVARPQRPLLDFLLPPHWRRSGLYIFDLPVTTAVANAAGRELWGLPKFVTDIPFSWHDDRFDVGVCEPGCSERICSLVGYAPAGSRMPLRSLSLYSQLGSHLLRTEVNLRGMGRVVRSPAVHLHIGSRLHPMAQRLVRLGLDGAMPALLQLAPRFQARLNLGRRIPVPVAAAVHQERQVEAA
ncbi:MAG: hypothetical protein KatS3mg077_2597 [Candidatus Binatia bacterium]|nr:MAG: hypothetical protein KatS3mg077_2597 [Candidatus Binatia bacterium]